MTLSVAKNIASNDNEQWIVRICKVAVVGLSKVLSQYLPELLMITRFNMSAQWLVCTFRARFLFAARSTAAMDPTQSPVQSVPGTFRLKASA
jgi:hypothetical protein